MTMIFEPRPNGIWAQVGENGRLFEFVMHKGRGTTIAALKWFNEQKKFQNPVWSLDACMKSINDLQRLVDQVAVDFPVVGSDYKFVIDDYRGCLSVLFGSLIVSETDNGFNIELITSWLTKERQMICNGLTLETAAELLRRSPDSRSFVEMDGRALHLSEKNREILTIVCGIQQKRYFCHVK